MTRKAERPEIPGSAETPPEAAVDSLGRILQVQRVALGLQQQDLARDARIPASSLSEYESDTTNPELPTLERLLEAEELPFAALDLTRGYIRRLHALRRAGAGAVPAGGPAPVELVALVAESKAAADRASNLLSSILRSVSAGEPCQGKPPGSEAEWVEELWTCLKRQSEARQRKLVQEEPRFCHPGLCERLCRESARQAARHPRKALHLADLAVLLAARIDRERGPAGHLQALAAAHRANALRTQGTLPVAEEAFGQADLLWVEAGREGEAPPGYEARILDLKSSLYRDQRLLPKALELIDQALALGPGAADRGRLLIQKSKIVEETGDLAQAIALLREAEPLVDPKSDPRLVLCQRHNLVLLLATAGRAEEAEALLPEVRTLSRKLNNELDLVRLQWTEARIDAGLGRARKALETLTLVRGAFASRGIDYDTALVTLELAALYAGQGRTTEVKNLARHLVPIFEAQKVHREALGALALFRQAAEREAVTVELARDLLAYLERARHDPGLRYGGC